MTKLRASFIVSIVALIALPAAGCKSGGGEPTDDTSREISNEELAQMVLALERFGPEFATFAPEGENGVRDIGAASEQDFDPAAERIDLETFGFVSAYETYYSSSTPAEGVAFFLGSQVVLFQTGAGASGYFEDSEKEVTEDIGKTSDGATLLEAEMLAFDDIEADQAMGARAVVRFTQEDGSSNDVWIAVSEFRRGRLLGGVGIYVIAPSNRQKRVLEEKAETLSQTMNEQMAAVLAAGAPTGAAQVPGQ